jgi:hypothetical protein
MPTADSSWKIYANAQKTNNGNEMLLRQNADKLANDKPGGVSPEIKIPRQGMGVTANDATSGSTTTQPVTGMAYKLESDPVYQAAINQGQSQFNSARNQAMYSLNDTTAQTNQDRKALDTNSAEARRRLAGNYAARGMAGGAAGALGLAEAEANARQIAAQTSLKDKLAALNMNFLENYGNANAAGYDWTGTLAGQQYKTQAAQTALTAKLSEYGVQ